MRSGRLASARRSSGSGSSGTTSPKDARRWRGCSRTPGAERPRRPRARALYGASVLADLQGDLDQAERLSREACDIYRQFDDVQGIAAAMTAMAFQTQRQGRLAEATSLFGETVSLWEKLGDARAADMARSNMASAAKVEGNFDLARSLLEQVAAPPRARRSARLRHRAERARRCRGAAGQSRRRAGVPSREPRPVPANRRPLGDCAGAADLASVDLQAGDYAEADAPLKEAVQAFRDLATSAAWPVSWSRCRGAPAASRATKRPSCWRAPPRPYGRGSEPRPSRPSASASSARWRPRGRASARTRTHTHGRKGSRRRSIACSASALLPRA